MVRSYQVFLPEKNLLNIHEKTLITYKSPLFLISLVFEDFEEEGPLFWKKYTYNICNFLTYTIIRLTILS